MALETELHTGVWVHPGVWVPSRGYTQVFEYAQVFGSPIGATHRCLESQPGLHTGVWIPSRGYTRVFGVQTGATHGCLESQMGDCASCHCQACQSSWAGQEGEADRLASVPSIIRRTLRNKVYPQMRSTPPYSGIASE